MSSAYVTESVAVDTTAPVLAGVRTNFPVSRAFRLSAGGATQAVAIKVSFSAVTQVGTLTLKLQTAVGEDWVDVKSQTFTSTVPAYIKLNNAIAGDAALMPLLSKGRVVLTTTNAGDSVTVTAVEVVQAS